MYGFLVENTQWATTESDEQDGEKEEEGEEDDRDYTQTTTVIAATSTPLATSTRKPMTKASGRKPSSHGVGSRGKAKTASSKTRTSAGAKANGAKSSRGSGSGKQGGVGARSSNEPVVRRMAWSAEEDDRLSALVAEHGAKRWSVIAELMPGRIGKQCRERWHNHVNPAVRKEEWTNEEDARILELHHQYVAAIADGREVS